MGEQQNTTKMNTSRRFGMLLTVLTALLCLALTAGLLMSLLGNGESKVSIASGKPDVIAMFDRRLSGEVSGALEGVIPIKREYWLSDSDLTAPEPDQDKFGRTVDPASLGILLERAQPLMEGQELLFSTETTIFDGSRVEYYLDDTIFAITWKQVFDNCVYTFSEVKIAHPSQLRRFFSEGRYNSGVLHTTTEMSGTVNAVVAASGDYYQYRDFGVVVNNGQVYRHLGHLLDTLYIDENGDFLFTYAGEIKDADAAKAFVQDNSVRFSLSFGPVMIRSGEYCVPEKYNSGEINSDYARAAFCQLGKLHYLVVTANMEEPHYSVPTVAQVAQNLLDLGVPTAYALDGGQTATIVMNDRLINKVSYGSQREISDILYFATAIPDAGRNEVGK